MTDIKLDMYSIDGLVRIGVGKTDDGIADDDGMISAIMVRLFTDRRADDNVRVDNLDNKRGFFGDALLPDDRRVGSHLWTIYRELITPDILLRIEDYCKDALSDMVEDNIINKVVASATATNDRVNLVVEFTKASDNQRHSIAFDNTIGDPNNDS